MSTSPRPYLNLSLHISGRRREVEGKLEWDTRYTDPAEYLRIARAAHAARIDSLFLADHPVLYRDRNEAPKHTLDPFSIMTTLLAQVPDIGAVATASTTLEHPFNLARRLQSLNWLTGGRVAWNLVATWNPAVAANYYAAPLGDHAARYRQATEATDIIARLWQSWDDSDTSSDLRGQPIDHNGEFYSVTGPLTVPNAPWGPPPIVQAGASAQGVALGGRFADLVYAVLHTKKGGHRYRNELRAAAEAAGRPNATIRIIPGLRIITGSTSEEVRRKVELENVASPADGPRAQRLATQIGIDLNGFDTNRPLDPAELSPGGDLPQGFFRAILDLVEENGFSFRQLLDNRAENHRQVTGTPDQIADDIEQWWRSGAVDGFTLTPNSIGDDLSLVLEEVIPILQSRGLYPREYEQSNLRERFAL